MRRLQIHAEFLEGKLVDKY